MGQKVNPIGYRLGVNKDWDSRWYANKDVYKRQLKEIEPKYYQKTYFLLPLKKNKAYFILWQVLNKQKYVALCKMVFHNKFTYAILRCSEDIFLITTLFFEEEMKDVPVVLSPKLGNKELELASLLVDKMKGHFEPDKYKDEYQNSLLKAIKDKAKGKKVKKSKKKKTQDISSLMEALEKSLKE